MAKDKAKKKKVRPLSIGGQAVMEGVMMRGTNSYSIAVRNQEGLIGTVVRPVGKRSKKMFFLKWPFIRGVVNFGGSLSLGIKTIYESAEMAGLDDLEDENPSKFEKFLTDKFGDKLFDIIMMFSVVVALALSVLLFMALPAWLSSLIKPVLPNRWLLSLFEGVLRITIFVGYLLLVSRTKEIKRVFAYHGAEHKTINCFESGAELTVENVRRHTRFHRRCGTSFLLIVMVVSMVVFFFVRIDNVWLKVLSRIALLPVVAGISFEILRYAGRNDNLLIKIISAPGVSLQNITTREPDDSMIEVAIEATNKVLETEDNAGQQR